MCMFHSFAPSHNFAVRTQLYYKFSHVYTYVYIHLTTTCISCELYASTVIGGG